MLFGSAKTMINNQPETRQKYKTVLADELNVAKGEFTTVLEDVDAWLVKLNTMICDLYTSVSDVDTFILDVMNGATSQELRVRCQHINAAFDSSIATQAAELETSLHFLQERLQKHKDLCKHISFWDLDSFWNIAQMALGVVVGIACAVQVCTSGVVFGAETVLHPC